MWSLANYLRVFTAINSIPYFLFFVSGLDSVLDEKIVYKFPDSRIAAANSIADDTFPSDFLFGAGTSSYQTEGAWNVSDKSPSVLDYWFHRQPNISVDYKNGDVAADSYHKYKDDIDLVERLGAKSYRFSLSWPRILPDGFNNRTSETGIAHYNDLINEIVRRGITPVATIYHWDIPQPLQELGGWVNPSVVDWFADYARLVFELFGDRVKFWTTMNQPVVACVRYEDERHGQYIMPSGEPDYLCGHNALLAHAKVYHIYDKEFRQKQKGIIGIVMGTAWLTPENSSIKAQVEATKTYWEFWNGYMIHPIFHPDGDYPPIMRSRVDHFSALQGFEKTRLPVFTPEQVELMKGTADYLGVNFYHTEPVGLKPYDPTSAGFHDDAGADLIRKKNTSFEEDCTPEALVLLINELNRRYKIPKIYITENGYGDQGQLMDVGRAKYHHKHLSTLLNILRSGVDVRGYMVWSLLDTFEWLQGYTNHFGLYSVDFNDPERKRTAKLSSTIVSKVYKSMRIPEVNWTLNDLGFRVV